MAITEKAGIRKTAIHFLISMNLIMLEFNFLELSDKLFFLNRYIKKKSSIVKDKSINTFWFIVLENKLADVSISEISLNNLLITIRAIISYCFDIYNVIDLGR